MALPRKRKNTFTSVAGLKQQIMSHNGGAIALRTPLALGSERTHGSFHQTSVWIPGFEASRRFVQASAYEWKNNLEHLLLIKQFASLWYTFGMGALFWPRVPKRTILKGSVKGIVIVIEPYPEQYLVNHWISSRALPLKKVLYEPIAAALIE